MISPKSVPDLLRASLPTAPEGEQPVRVLICGIPSGVEQMVHQLYLRGFAQVGEWSPPLPSPLEGEIIRILVRYWMAE
jgi:hypothetical protein